jgi:hypothetical protein
LIQLGFSSDLGAGEPFQINSLQTESRLAPNRPIEPINVIVALPSSFLPLRLLDGAL